MNLQSTYYVVGISCVSIPLIIKLLRWYNAGIEARAAKALEEKIKDSFVTDMATNHLPHLFNSDQKLAEGLNLLLENMGSSHKVEIAQAPPIRWLPFDPHE